MMYQNLSRLGFTLLVVGICGGAFILMQIMPYHYAPTNPPVVATPQWDSPRTAELAARSCNNCHSNQTQWPWYSYLAPASWEIHRTVQQGRAVMNFSDWKPLRIDAQRAAGAVYIHYMPLKRYLLLDPSADLTDQEAIELSEGLRKTILASQGKQ